MQYSMYYRYICLCFIHLGKRDVEAFMVKEGIEMPYTKVRTKIMNEQRKCQMRARYQLKEIFYF